MSYGTAQSMGQLSGTPLIKMHITDFATEAEAIECINNTESLPSNLNYLIIPFTSYTKPVPQAK